MLFDLRTYRVKPGTLTDQLKHYADHGYDVQRKHLGAPLLYSVVETGDVNSYIHLWQYQNAVDREERRAALQSDPAWIAYRKGAAELGVQTSQNNMLLKPAFFWSK